MAGESSTATWTVVWTDRLTSYEHYQAKAYRVDPVPGTPGQYIAYIAYDLDLFEEGSIANLTSSIIGNVFGFKALKALRLEDMRIPPHYVKTFQGPPHGIVMEREYLDKFGRPLLGATTKPKLGLSAKNYGRVVYEALRGGLDFTKDDENINSQPFMRWRDRYLYAMEAVQPRVGRDRRGQGPLHERDRRRRWRRCTSGPSSPRRSAASIVMIDLTVGYTAMTVDVEVGARATACCCTCTAPATAPTRARRPTACRFRVIAKWCRLLGVDHIHAGTVVGKLEGDPATVRGYYDVLPRAPQRRPTPATGLYFDQDWASLPGVMPVASGGIHAGQMHQLLHYLGEDVDPAVRRRHDRPPDGHRRRRDRQPRRRRGDDPGAQRGPRLLRARARTSSRRRPRAARELDAALEVWKDITFDFESTDTPDVVVTPTRQLTRRPTMRITQGTFSFLPDLTDEQIEAQLRYALRNGWAIMVEHTDDPHPRNALWEMWGQPLFDLDRGRGRHRAARGRAPCREAYPRDYVKVVAYDRSLGRQTTALSFIVRPARRRSPASGSSAARRPTARSATRLARLRHRPRRSGGATTVATAAPTARRERARPSRRPSAAPPAPRSPASRTCSTQLDRDLVALAPVKTRIREIAALLVIDRLRREAGSAPARPTLHMSFTGNPGTGKTTVALRMAEILHRLGYIEHSQGRRRHARRPRRPVRRPHRAEDQRGAQARLRRRAVHRRGVLPLPPGERARLRPGGDRDPAPGDGDRARRPRRRCSRATATAWRLLPLNPGMGSRVAHHIDFPDFDVDELMAIAGLMLEQQAYELTPEAEQALRAYVERRVRAAALRTRPQRPQRARPRAHAPGEPALRRARDGARRARTW